MLSELKKFLKGDSDFSKFSNDFKKVFHEIPANLPAEDLQYIQKQKNRLLLAVFSDTLYNPTVSRMKVAMEFLIESGANNNNDALVHACGVRIDTEEMLDFVKGLIERGADIHYQNEGEQTSLRQAVFSGNYLLATYLLDSGVNPNFSEHSNALFSLIWGSPTKAGEQAGLELIDLLLRKGININAQDHKGRTVLQHAVLSGCDPKLIRYLSDRGAEPTPMGPLEAKPSAAVYVRELPAPELRKLVGLYWELNDAIKDQNLEAVNRFFRINPLCFQYYSYEILISNILVNIYMHSRVRESTDIQLQIIKELIAHGADLSYRGSSGYSLLHEAVLYQKNIELVRLFLDQLPNLIEVTNNFGQTALHTVCANQKPDPSIIQLLIERGVNVNAQITGKNDLGRRRSFSGDTALHVICRQRSENSADTIRLLLNNNANPLLPSDDRQLIPLAVAAENADLVSVETLLKHRNRSDYDDQTLKDVYCRYKIYLDWRHPSLLNSEKRNPAYEKIDAVFEAEFKRRGISENLNFLSDIRFHAQKAFDDARSPRAKLKSKLVHHVLQELKKDPAKSSVDLLTQKVELPKNRFTPGELKILKDNTSFSLHDALNFHRNWFGRGYTATYLKFMPKRSDLTPRDQVILFLEQVQNRLRTSSGSAQNEKRSLLNEYIQNLKKSASTLTLKEICEQRFAQGPNLLQILNYKREGGKTSFLTRNETFTPQFLRKSKRPRSYSDFEKEFALKSLLDDQAICDLLNQSKRIEISTNTPK